LVEVVNERANTSPMPPHELYQRLLQTEQRVEARPGRREASGHLGDTAAHVANRGGSRPPPSAPYGKAAPPPPCTRSPWRWTPQARLSALWPGGPCSLQVP
jgi:hypothetical protein